MTTSESVGKSIDAIITQVVDIITTDALKVPANTLMRDGTIGKEAHGFTERQGRALGAAMFFATRVHGISGDETSKRKWKNLVNGICGAVFEKIEK